MGHTRKAVLVFAALLAIAAARQTSAPSQTPAPAQAPAPAQTPAVRQIPGITAKDPYPNGCVDCHVAGRDADMRMSVLMTQWMVAVPAALVDKAKAASADATKIKGKHPAVPNAKTNLPQTCAGVCHKAGSTIAPPFGRLLHLIHLTGGAKNRFLTAQQGDCTHCHKLDQKTGAWKTASGSEK